MELAEASSDSTLSASAPWGAPPAEVTLVSGPLRILGKSFAICCGTLLRVERDGIAFPLSSTGTGNKGCYLDILFKIGPGGVTAAELEALVAGVPKAPKRQGRDAATTFLEGSVPDRYPDFYKGSGGTVVCCMCEQREVGFSPAGAMVLHATSLRSVDASSTVVSPAGDSLSLAPKVDRHSIFASWIVNTFGGLAALAGGLIDVAGGKGHLSNAIAATGLNCTLVDPFAGLGRDPIGGFHCGDGLDGSVGLLLDRNVRCVKATLEDAEIHVPGLMADCSAIVALHPDEATEPALDAARAAGRPFAIVPCCVFRKQFPGRLLRNGGAVVKYGNFLRYLREKDSRMRICTLPFTGRNVVIYMTAEDFDRPNIMQSPDDFNDLKCFAGQKVSIEIVQGEAAYFDAGHKSGKSKTLTSDDVLQIKEVSPEYATGKLLDADGRATGYGKIKTSHLKFARILTDIESDSD